MYFSEEDILRAEHEALCYVALGEPSNDFVAGEVRGILYFVSDLLASKRKEGDG